MGAESLLDEPGDVGRAGIRSRAKYYFLSYPMFWLGVVFVVPLTMLFVVSFFVNIPGSTYRFGFTLENHVRFVTRRLYLQQLWVTIHVSLVTAGISLVVGYPISYYLARMRRAWLRDVLMLTIISSLWVTYVIRAYAWQVILASGGILSGAGVRLGVLKAPRSFYPGYWALVIGMVYVFLPFMILTLYSSLRNIDEDLIDASRNLGAGPFTTFRRVTLPLSKNGIFSGTVLVFILALGAYVLPRLLGSTSERTLPVLIERQIVSEANYPMGAVMSIALVLVVLAFLWVAIRFTNVTTASLSGRRDGANPHRRGHRGQVPHVDAFTDWVQARLRRVMPRHQLRRVVGSVDARTRERVIRVTVLGAVIATMGFVAVPLGIIIAVSFTPERFLTFPPGGFSLEWYVDFFTDRGWVLAFVNSLWVAAGAAILSTTIGGTLAFSLDRFDYSYRTLLGSLGVLPILIPPVIIGVAFLVFFLRLGLQGTRVGVIIAHGIFYSPLPFILILQGLDELDRTYEEASMNLGASPVYTLRTITYPLLRANVVASGLFAFILSLNEYIIAWLLSFLLFNTIPIHLFNQIRYGYSPTIAAASVIFIILTVAIMTVIDRMTGGIWE